MTATPLIHVVDDDESMRTALVRAIHSAGLEVRGYDSSGELLLKLWGEHPHLHRAPASVQLDEKVRFVEGVLERLLSIRGSHS